MALRFLAAAGAVAVLAEALGVAWLYIVALVVAVVGAVVRVVIAVMRAARERAIERLGRDQHLRVPVARIGEIDPTLIGVDPAARTILGGGTVPQYVPRRVDGALGDAILAAVEGRGPWFVVLRGKSKVGKSRTLFEALRNLGRAELQLVAPHNREALVKLLDPETGWRPPAAPAVLWLDDLEPFLNQGMTLPILREWRSGGPQRIVVATYGGKGSERVAGSGSRGLATIANEIMGLANEIDLKKTTGAELDLLRPHVPEPELAAIERHGLAAHLVAAPALERKLTTGLHAPGEDPCQEGAAVVRAAVDWARCGRSDPISEQTLLKLWPAYLEEDATADDGFAAGLEWALRPVAGSIALLQRTGGYRAYDYIVQWVRDSPDAHPPGEQAWAAAIESAADSQALTVAASAYHHGRLDAAAAMFGRAQESTSDRVAAWAGYDLGVVLKELAGPEHAVTAYDLVVDRFGDDSAQEVHEQVARALYNKGNALMQLDQPDDALAAYDRLVDRFGDDPASELREQVAWALVNKGVALGQLNRPDDALAAYDRVVDRFGDDPAPELREQVAAALFNKGVVLGQLNRPDSAVATYDQVADRFGDDPAPELREQVAKALVNKGNALLADRPDDAVTTYDQVVGRFGDDPAPGLREQVARALLNKGVALGQLNRPDDAVTAYEKLVDRFGDEPAPELRERVAKALFNKGVALMQLNRPDDALATYDRVADAFGDDPAPELREQVAKALVNSRVARARSS